MKTLLDVSVGTSILGTIYEDDHETIDDIRRIVSSTIGKKEVKKYLAQIGIPYKSQKDIVYILGGGSWSDSVSYFSDRKLDINDILNQKVSAMQLNQLYFGLNEKASAELFSYQWHTQPIMGKGEVWLSLILNGGSKAGVGDVNVYDKVVEVKGRGARLVGQRGFGDAKKMSCHLKTAIMQISVLLGIHDYKVLDGNGLEWSVTKTSARLLGDNLKIISNMTGGFSDTDIEIISTIILEAYTNLYVMLNYKSYVDSFKSAFNEDGSIDVNKYNNEILKISFAYYLQIEKFDYFAMTNELTHNVLVIEPSMFNHFVDNGTILYSPQSWGEKAGTQGGYFAIGIDKLSEPTKKAKPKKKKTK